MINLSKWHSRIRKVSVINPEKLILSRTRKVSFIRKKCLGKFRKCHEKMYDVIYSIRIFKIFIQNIHQEKREFDVDLDLLKKTKELIHKENRKRKEPVFEQLKQSWIEDRNDLSNWHPSKKPQVGSHSCHQKLRTQFSTNVSFTTQSPWGTDGHIISCQLYVLVVNHSK